jgi:hypothetical protein
MKIFKLLLASIFVLSLIGCGGDDDNTDDTKAVDTFDMDKTTYQVPEGVTLVDTKIEGTTATMMSAGANEELAAFVQEIATVEKASKSYKVMQKGVDTAFALLSSGGGSIDSISLFSSQSFQTPYAFTIAQYKLETNKEIEPLTLAGEIVTTLSGGTATGLPLASANAPVDTSFRLILLYGEYESSAFYIAVVVPEQLYADYETEGTSITNAARVIPKGQELTTSSENFTQATAKQNADILFVVDDSGSMSDNQNALSQAADDFTAEMTTSGLSYRSAIITTGYGATDPVNGAAYSILRSVGIIENNTTLLKESLVAGTNGSGTETGIWNAEQSLQSLAYNNNYDGAVTLAGMPKVDSTLSVVIISDESSQYRSRSNGVDFNVSNNLFIDRGIRVYSLIETESYIIDNSQYDELSASTGGIHSNIGNQDVNGSLDFSGFMEQIAKDAGGAASSFILAHSATVINEVKVNGTVIAEDALNGYTYVQSSRAIVFHGTSVPASGATIEVSYDYYQ